MFSLDGDHRHHCFLFCCHFFYSAHVHRYHNPGVWVLLSFLLLASVYDSCCVHADDDVAGDDVVVVVVYDSICIRCVRPV